jgi:hypothetical protein
VDEGGPEADTGSADAQSDPAVDPAAADQSADADATITDPNADPATQTLEESGTFVNALLIVDLDGDGDNDIVGTIDRNELSGLTADALVWFRNNLR